MEVKECGKLAMELLETARTLCERSGEATDAVSGPELGSKLSDSVPRLRKTVCSPVDRCVEAERRGEAGRRGD